MINSDNSGQDRPQEAELDCQLIDRAYALLSRREHSAHELRQKLKQKFAGRLGDETCDEIVGRLTRQGAQSDERFAEMLCRSRFNAGKGPVRLQRELQEHQIEDHLIDAAMTQYNDSWRDLAEQVRGRKFGCSPPSSYAEWAKQARFLQQRGFSTAQIRQYSESIEE